MGKDKSVTNIIPLQDYREQISEPDSGIYKVEDVSDFIADMLQTLKCMAAKTDQPMLVYFLDMARTEALEMKNVGDTDDPASTLDNKE